MKDSNVDHSIIGPANHWLNCHDSAKWQPLAVRWRATPKRFETDIMRQHILTTFWAGFLTDNIFPPEAPWCMLSQISLTWNYRR